MASNFDDSVFSLEEDDCSQLFLTQTPRQEQSENVSDRQFWVATNDFASPCVSLTGYQPQFSDISEDEFDIGKENNR